jgi:hypothetical protein
LCIYFLEDVLEAKELVVQLVNCRLYMMEDLVNVSWNPKALEYCVDGFYGVPQEGEMSL